MSTDADGVASAQAQLDACTRCGLCLESCPTYTLWARELDSPRGRIALVADACSPSSPNARNGPPALTPNPILVEHIDACVGCGICVSVCPEGVQYTSVLDLARGAVRRERAPTPLRRGRESLLRNTLSSPRRLRTLAPTVAAARRAQTTRAPEPIQTLTALPLAPPSARQLTAPIPPFTPAHGRSRGHVALLLGCAERVFSSDLERTAVAVLAAEGYDVSAPAEPSCCGGWARELGDLEAWHASAYAARAALARIGGVDAVLTVAGRCTDSLAGGDVDAAIPVRDVIRFLAAIKPRAVRRRLDWRVARHSSCQQRHGVPAFAGGDPAGTLLATIPGVEVLATTNACCGGRGLYPARRPQAATALRDLAVAELIEAGAQAIVSDEPVCAEQLARGLAQAQTLPVRHPLELLWLALQPPA